MYSLLISLYELGQFLRIFLWITLPAAVIAMLLSTYFHYRRKREEQEGAVYAIEGYGLAGRGETRIEGYVAGEAGSGALEGWKTEGSDEKRRMGDDEKGEVRDDPNEKLQANEKIYRGILWMKEKYEQYRDLADRRYEQVKEELARAEKRYEDLLAERSEGKVQVGKAGSNEKVGESNRDERSEKAGEGKEGKAEGSERAGEGREVAEETLVWTGSDADREAMREIVKEKNRQIHLLLDELDQRIKNYHQLEYQGRDNRSRIEELERQLTAAQQTLEEQKGRIGELEGLLLLERDKVEEMVGKLQDNSLLLLNIYKELDRSLNAGNPASPTPPAIEV